MKSNLSRFLTHGLVLIVVTGSGACRATFQHVVAQTKETQAATTAKQALELLAEGNRRFCSGDVIRRDLPAQVRETADGQYPLAAIVSCMDSRTSSELVFDQGIGDIFNVRIAGNVADEDVLASLEYAAKVAGTRLFVVLGHTHCGAVKAACDDVKMGNITALLGRIKPAVDAVPASEQPRNSKNHEFVEHVAAANVRHTMQQILEQSPVLKEMLDAQQIVLVGGMYDVESGRVVFYGS